MSAIKLTTLNFPQEILPRRNSSLPMYLHGPLRTLVLTTHLSQTRAWTGAFPHRSSHRGLVRRRRVETRVSICNLSPPRGEIIESMRRQAIPKAITLEQIWRTIFLGQRCTCCRFLFRDIQHSATTVLPALVIAVSCIADGRKQLPHEHAGLGVIKP